MADFSNKTLVPLHDFAWTDDYSFMRVLTCVNHPTAKYLTKNVFNRHLHVVDFPEGMTRECPCPLDDLRVVAEESGAA
jgi:hypothetical protein